MANPAVANTTSVQIVVAGNPGAIQASLIVPAASSGPAAPQGQLLGVDSSVGVVAKLPAGAFVAYAGAGAPPSGFLLCDGSAVSRTTFAALFGVLGTTYGAGDGSTTFNLPDLRGRVIVGADAGAGRLSRSAYGGVAGAAYVALDASMIPAHNHGLADGTLVIAAVDVAPHVNAFLGGTTINRSAVTISPQGSSALHNNLPPTLNGQWLVAV